MGRQRHMCTDTLEASVRTARQLVPSAIRSMVSRHLHLGHRELNVAGFPSSQVGAARVDVPLVLLRV